MPPACHSLPLPSNPREEKKTRKADGLPGFLGAPAGIRTPVKPAAARPASPLDPLRSKNASRFGVRGFESSDDHKKQNRPHKAVCFAFGAPAGIRTPDTLLKRQVLCLLSYWGVAGMAGLEPTISESKSGVLPLHYIPIYRPPQQGLSAKTGRHCRPVACLWGGIWGSNPRHPEPQSGALPTELIPPYQFLRREGGQSAAPNLLPPSGVGTPRGIRTPDLLLRRPLLYPAELRTHILHSNHLLAIQKRVMGIEPTYLAWKASVLPLNYTRMAGSSFSQEIIPYKSRACQHFFRAREKKTGADGCPLRLRALMLFFDRNT